MSDAGRPPRGWYPDPEDGARLRWWDGTAWTGDRATRPPGPSPPRGLRPVGDFVVGAFRAVVAALGPLLVLAAIAIVPFVVALVLADAQLGFTDWVDEFVEVAEQTDPGEDLDVPRWDVNAASAGIWAIAIVILYLFNFAVLPLAAVPLVDPGQRDGALDLDAAVRTGLRAVPRAVVVGLVVLVAVVLVVLAVLVVSVAVPVLGVLLALAAVPVAIWLSVRLLVLYQPLVVIEGLGLGLFRRSWELTRGYAWGLLGRSVLFGLIVGFASNLVTFPIQLFGAADPQLATLLGFVVGVAAGSVSGMVQVAGPVLLYRDLVDGPPVPEVPRAWGSPPTL